MRLFRWAITYCLVLASAFFLAAEVYAVGTHPGRQSAGNGTSEGCGTRQNNQWVSPGKFYRHPFVWPYGQKCETWVEVCCDNCPSECPTDCCVEYTISWTVEDANGVPGPPNSSGTKSSCNPCQQCQIYDLVEQAGGTGYPVTQQNTGTWRWPATRLVYTVIANCKCCPGTGAHAAVNLNDDAAPEDAP